MNQIQTGIGDNLDLAVKMPTEEDTRSKFKGEVEVEGTIDKEHQIYPEIHFDVGVQYSGKVLDTYNEGEYEIGMEAHPEVCVPYTVKQEKEMPVERVWEAEAKFEAEVDITEMEYAIEAHGGYKYPVGSPAQYRIEWCANAGDTVEVQNVKDLLQSSKAISIGAGGLAQYTIEDDKLVDPNNISKPAGVVVKDLTNLENFEIEYSFMPIQANYSTNRTLANTKRRRSTGHYVSEKGMDDDVVGFIFGFKDAQNFYCMLWESNERTFLGARFPNIMDGMQLTTNIFSTADMLADIGKAYTNPNELLEKRGEMGKSYHGWAMGDGNEIPPEPTAAQWDYYNKKTGWREQHRRLYKVIGGRLYRIDENPPGREGGHVGKHAIPGVYDVHNGKGWVYKEERKVKIQANGDNVKIYVTDHHMKKEQTDYRLVYDFTMDPGHASGSFGVINISQAVEFLSISARSRNFVCGIIPEDEGTDWWTVKEPVKTVTPDKIALIRSRIDFKNKVQKFGGDPEKVEITEAYVKIRDPSSGKVVKGQFGTKPIEVIIESNYREELFPVTVRIPSEGWDKWKGIGQKKIADSGFEYAGEALHNEIKKILGSEYDAEKVSMSGISGIVNDPKKGKVITTGNAKDPIFIETFNPPDAGQIIKKRYIYCDVITVTPDHRDKDSCLLVFENIEDLFVEQRLAFFSRPDFINEKEEYNLLIPKPQSPPEPEVPEDGEEEVIAEGGCVAENQVQEVEEPCWEDFHFDGKKLCMWYCEFPVEIHVKDFKACFAKFEGEKEFNPINDFIHNKWSVYELFYSQADVDPSLDHFGWKNTSLNFVEKDTIIGQTSRYYLATFESEDSEERKIRYKGYLDTDEGNNVNFIDIPRVPVHFVHPIKRNEQMSEYDTHVHYFAKIYEKHPDIIIHWSRHDPLYGEFIAVLEHDYIDEEETLLKLNMLKDIPYDLDDHGEKVPIEGFEVVYLDFIYKLRAVIKENIKARNWNSGMHKMKLSVNGVAPFTEGSKGKRDLNDVNLRFPDFPEGVIDSTIVGPEVVVIPRTDLNPADAKLEYKIDGDKASFSSNTRVPFVEKIPVKTSYRIPNEMTAVKKENPVVSVQSSDIKAPGSTFQITKLKYKTDNPFISLYPYSSESEFIKNYNSGKKAELVLAALLKDSYPDNWSPLVHNGYFYLKWQEYYLYAEKSREKLKQSVHLTQVRPQQGAPVLVEAENPDRMFKEVHGTDTSKFFTREVFVSKGNPMFYLSGRGIRTNQFKVKVDGAHVPISQYMIDLETPKIEFYHPIKRGSVVDIEYLSREAYYLDRNPIRTKYSSKKDTAEISISPDISVKDRDVYVVYESAKNTPFYKSDVVMNPILTSRSKGFLFITDEKPQPFKMRAYHSTDYYEEKDDQSLVTFVLEDENGVAVPEERISVYVNGVQKESSLTSKDGSLMFVLDTSSIKEDYAHIVGVYNPEIKGEVLLDISKKETKKRKALILESKKLAYLSEEEMKITIKVKNELYKKNSGLTRVEFSHYDNGVKSETFGIIGEEQVVTIKAPKSKGSHLIVAKTINEEESAITSIRIKVE